MPVFVSSLITSGHAALAKNTLSATTGRSRLPRHTLRKAFHAQELTAEVFSEYYISELKNNPAFSDFIALVRNALTQGDVVLLTTAQITPYGHCETLRNLLLDSISK